MFKSWQVFVFSLVPLLLIFAGVIAGSIHGSDSAKEVFPTPAPAPPPSSSSSTTPGGPAVLQISASNLQWSTRTLTAPPNTAVTVQVNNKDAGVLHDFSVYTNSQATTKIFGGELHAGPGTFDYKFTTPAAGTYFFRCDVHPDTMTGTLTVR